MEIRSFSLPGQIHDVYSAEIALALFINPLCISFRSAVEHFVAYQRIKKDTVHP